jgi:regulatory protein
LEGSELGGLCVENSMKKELIRIANVMERFCAYQERSTGEVNKKLNNDGITRLEAEEIIKHLQANGFLNDERYAKHYTSGKFRIKKWGKIKIASELKMKKISPEHIRSALDTIDSAEYARTILHLITKKEKEIKKDLPSVKNQKTVRFLVSKGYELSQILSLLKNKTAL